MKAPPKIKMLRTFLKANNITAKTLAFAFHEQCDIQTLFDMGFIHVEDKRVKELETRITTKEREIADLKIAIANLQAEIEEMTPYSTTQPVEKIQYEAVSIFDDGMNKFKPYRATTENMTRWVYDVKSEISNEDESDIEQVKFTNAHFTEAEFITQARTHLSTCYKKWHHIEEYDDTQNDIQYIKRMLRDKLNSKIMVEGLRKKLVPHALLLSNIKLLNGEYKEYYEVLSDITDTLTQLVREYNDGKFKEVARPKAKSLFDESGARCEINQNYTADMSSATLEI